MPNLITDQDQEVFKQVSDISEELRRATYKDNTFKPIEWYRDRMNRLTGDYMYLSERYGKMKGAKDRNWTDAYMQAKLDSNAAGEKFVNASAERTADHAVKELSEAVLVFEGYLKASEQGVLTCKKNVDVEVEELRRETT